MRPDKLLIALVLAFSAKAQITLQGKAVGTILDYYTAHPVMSGDTNYCILTAATYANGSSAGTSVYNLNDGAGNQTINGKVFCTANDGTNQAGDSRNIFTYNLTVLDMSSASNTTAIDLNNMSSFGTGGTTNTPTGWTGQGTSGQGSGYSWKSGPPISFGGWIVLPIFRQSGPTFYVAGDSTVIVSPDGGVHWCNPYTYANRSGGAGCDSVNWKTDGDAPLPPSDPSYTATPSSIMFKDVSPYDGSTNLMGRITFFDYCQDNSCTGSPDNADTYLYGFGGSGLFTRYGVFRVTKNITSLMDVTSWGFYNCTNYSPSNICDGLVGGNWSSTPANQTMLFAGVGVIAGGGSQSINPVPNGYTNQMGIGFGNPVYSCSNGGCSYLSTRYQQYLTTGADHSAIMAFPHPWGPFTPLTSEFSNSIAGFWAPLRYTVSNPDSTPYHSRFVMVGDNFSLNGQGTVYFQSYDVTLGSNENGMSLAGCSQYRLTYSPVAGSIIRRGLWSFFDILSHGCYTHRLGNIYYPSMYAGDISTYPANRQLIGCFSDGGNKCGTPEPATHKLALQTYGMDFGNVGYQARVELTDTVPGVYNRTTSNLFTTSADPIWTASYVVYPYTLGTTNQALFQVGVTDHRAIGFVSAGASGKYGIRWDLSGGATVSAISTNSVLTSAWHYVTASKSAGAVTVCGSVPCAPSSATVHIYVDGVEVPVTRTNTGTPDMQAGTLSIAGGDPALASFEGALGIVELYSRVISPDEVQHNYKAHQARLANRNVSFVPAGTLSWASLTNGQWTGLTNGQWTGMTN